MGRCCLYFLAVFLPFVAVAMKKGCGSDLCINILLCCLGWLPGVIHACYVIAQPNDPELVDIEAQPTPAPLPPPAQPPMQNYEAASPAKAEYNAPPGPPPAKV